MEVNWAQYQLDRYAIEAALLEQRLQHSWEPRFLDLALNLLRTYVDIPRESLLTPVADLAVTQLARFTYQPIQERGDWYEIMRLWPRLCQIALCVSRREVKTMLPIQLATVSNNLGRHREAEAIYCTLLTAPDFLDLIFAQIEGKSNG